MDSHTFSRTFHGLIQQTVPTVRPTYCSVLQLNGEDILRTEFRPMYTLPPDDVQQDFGHRVARFCLHNPTFVTQRILGRWRERERGGREGGGGQTD